MNQVALYEITSQHNDIVVINQPVFSANTGLDWLPSVPSLWQIVRFKNLFCVIYRYPTYFNIEYVPEGVPEVRGEALTSDGYIEKLVDERYISHETNSLFPMTQLQIGDIVMSVRGTMGKIGIVDERYAGANITANLLRLSPDKNRVGGEFLRWLMQSNYFNESLNSSAPQTTIKTITMPQLTKIRIALPPLAEQERIAAYLDASCAALDAAVAAKRRQIEILDGLRKTTIQRAITEGLAISPNLVQTQSKILAQIPAGWKLARLKAIAEIRYGLGQPPPAQEGGVPMIRATNIDAGTILEKDMLYVDRDELPLDRNPYLKENEIIVVRSGAYTGDSAIVPLKYVGAVAGYDMVVTVTQAEPTFIAYSLLSDYILEGQMRLLTLRAAQAHLNAEELGSIIFAVPSSRAEQQAIITYLDIKLTEIRSIESMIEAQIDTLVAYRKALIHECVTGQRRLTDAEVTAIGAHAQAVAAWRTGETAHG